MNRNITRYEPWALLDQIQRDLNDLFVKPSRTGEDLSRVETSQWMPAVDIKEEADKFLVRVDLPGVKPENTEITMEDGVLTIKGTREQETKEETKNYIRTERVQGTFYRRFSLPDTADSENIKAKSNHGVLEITIPKKEKAKPKKITVKAEEEV